MDLREPNAKMGKSGADGSGVIFLLDKPDVMVAKVRRAVTDRIHGASALKTTVADVLVETLTPIQKLYAELVTDPVTLPSRPRFQEPGARSWCARRAP